MILSCHILVLYCNISYHPDATLILSTFPHSHKGANIQSSRGAGVFDADKLFISTRFGGPLKMSNFITCLYRTVLEVNCLFHAESAQNYLFKKTSSPQIEWWPLNDPQFWTQKQTKSKKIIHTFTV